MAYNTKYPGKGKKNYGKRKRPAVKKARKVFAKRVMSVVNKKAETKSICYEICHDLQLLHNTTANLNVNAFYTECGTRGEQGYNGAGTRIGSKLYCKGLQCSIMIENQQYRPQATYWLYLLRSRNQPMDSITQSGMFEGRSTILPMDYLDMEKVQIMYCKKFVLKMPNIGSSEPMGGTVDGAANLSSEGVESEETYGLVTNPQVIKKFYVKVNKIIKYQDDNDGNRTIPVGDHRYQWVMMAYNNAASTTGGATYPVGHVSMTQRMIFTDV